MRPYLLIAYIILPPVLLCGCSQRAALPFREANDLFARGSYTASLSKYEEIAEKYPAEADRALFERGIIYAHSGNERKDYQKALEHFRKVVKEYPESRYRKDSEMMIFNITTLASKERTIAAQQRQIEALREQLTALREEVTSRTNETTTMQRKIEALEHAVTSKEKELSSLQQEVLVLQSGPADKILIEKKARRLTLLSKGKALKTYTIALGGDPEGPKERQGDNKTPEGTYIIDSRNRNSGYHLSLRISYPNEKDRKRARELGVAPGGDIMIHGLKNEFSWAGGLHTSVDWTKGCIAVTDREIEEIEKLVPNGTLVEIRP